ncbi:MAG: exo-beta-N-acetylmuramidase NamZ domain-containing protein [Ignavibacteriaceae bacterium]
MKRFILLIVLMSSFIFAQTPKIKLGIDVLKENNFRELKGKKVGLITNPTGVNSYLVSTIDILAASREFELVALYGPEHGVRGDYAAGDYVENYTDEKTQLPVFSLYGKTRKPTKEMLKGIEVLVFDIQDIGCRSYTYISTMGVAMEAAAENNIEFVVLDRPNPLGGNKVEGNLAEDGFISFISQFKIPYVHGLTVGELAMLLNDEGMLAKGVKCDLKVVPMEGWKRGMNYEATGLEWIPTSPHVPYKETSGYYVATGVLGELGVISEGVGYTIPFQVYAAEWIDAGLMADKMNELEIEGITFRPIVFKPFYGKNTGKRLSGVQLHITNFEKVNLMELQFRFLEVHNMLYPEKNPFELCDKSRIGMFDKACGTSKIRELFTKEFRFADIKEYLDKDIKSFRNVSKKYHLYSN